MKALLNGLLLLLAVAMPAGAEAPTASRLEKAASDVVVAALEYRAALERLLPVYERELARRVEQGPLRRDLFNRGVLNQREFEDGQQAQAAAQRNLEETRRGIAEADRMVTEARIAQALARLALLTPDRAPREVPSATSPGPAPSSSPSR